MGSELQAAYDAVVVGGGPAGLSAALTMGRACRRTLLVDAGPGRNAPADAVHGFLGQDGTPPAELRRIGRAQLAPYDVDLYDGRVTAAQKCDDRFELEIDGKLVRCRSLILATGIVDGMPPIEGAQKWWGRGLYLCPYCHGWEIRNRPWAFLSPAAETVDRGTMLLGWTKDLTYLTGGEDRLTPEVTAWLTAHDIPIRTAAIARLDGDGAEFAGVTFVDGQRLDCAAVFCSSRFSQPSPLAVKLGCEVETTGHIAGTVKTDLHGVTSIAGLYIAGDAASSGAMSVASAASEGMMAAVTANMAMLKADAGGN